LLLEPLLPLELLRPLPPLDRFSRDELLLLRLELPPPLLRLELLLLPPLLLLPELLLLPPLLLLELLLLLLLLLLELLLLLLLLLLLELLSAPPCLLWARAVDTSRPATHSNMPATLNAAM